MRYIVQDVITFATRRGITPDSLVDAHRLFGDYDLGVLCIMLAGWWRRPLLLKTQHPYMKLSPKYPWCVQLRQMAHATPQLNEILRFDEYRCHFSDALTAEELAEINEYAQANYNPPVMT